MTAAILVFSIIIVVLAVAAVVDARGADEL